jgi:hypothetical protein
MRIIKRSIFIFLLFPCLSYAAWPEFNVLSPAEVMQKVITEGCPAGEGKILPGTKVIIQNRNIPPDQTWYWEYSGTEQCHKLLVPGQELKYVAYRQDGRNAGGKLITFYGIENDPLFSFTFTVPFFPEGWDCGFFYSSTLPARIGCARDS